MDEAAKFRGNYLKLLHQNLKENVKKSSDLNLDDDMLTHFAMRIEEDCFNRNRNFAAYTKSLTLARLSIEKFTATKKLFPMIAESFKIDEKSTEQKENGKKISMEINAALFEFQI